jgi:tetratricopeptide (TPR) repeat protein
MALVYDDLEDFEKVLAQHEIIRPILVKLGKSKEVSSLDLQTGETLISVEKFKEAIVKLKEVVKETKEASRFHGHALVLIGKAYAEMEENSKAAKYCKKALNALKNKKYSLEAGSSLMELGSVYQQINEPDQAMVCLKLAHSIFKHHPDQLGAAAEIEGQIGGLLLYTGKVKEALPYLEKSVDLLENIYGKDSVELLAVYNHIAIAYLELERYEDALTKFEAARVISTENHGPEDGDTVAIYCNLANTYSALER